MKKVELFTYHGGQAVKLPEEYSFPGLSEVFIHKIGNKVILEPTKHSWENLRKGIEMLPDDFDFKRNTPDKS